MTQGLFNSPNRKEDILKDIWALHFDYQIIKTMDPKKL